MSLLHSFIFVLGSVAIFFTLRYIIDFLVKKIDIFLKGKGSFIFRIFLYALIFSFGRWINILEVSKNNGVMTKNFPWGDWIFLGSRTYFSIGDFLQFGGIVSIILGILIYFFDSRYIRKIS